MADPAELTPETARIPALLEVRIASRKIRIRELERRLKVSNGTCARLFSGKISLKFQHILDILAILDVTPRAFFRVENRQDIQDVLELETDQIGRAHV